MTNSTFIGPFHMRDQKTMERCGYIYFNPADISFYQPCHLTDPDSDGVSVCVNGTIITVEDTLHYFRNLADAMDDERRQSFWHVEDDLSDLPLFNKEDA